MLEQNRSSISYYGKLKGKNMWTVVDDKADAPWDWSPATRPTQAIAEGLQVTGVCVCVLKVDSRATEW